MLNLLRKQNLAPASFLRHNGYLHRTILLHSSSEQLLLRAYATRYTPNPSRFAYKPLQRDHRSVRPDNRPRPSYRGTEPSSNHTVDDEVIEGTAEKKEEYITKFTDLATNGHVSSVLVRTITESMGMETMTPVQSQTINETLDGVDVIAQARTGTGKTLAFLIPLIQNILANNPQLKHRSRGSNYLRPDVRAVIISPTRELAEQIAAEALRLVANTSVKVQTAVGGTRKSIGLRNIMTRGCNLLVGTPGRLKDIFQDPTCNIDLSKVHGFVLDEADRLLDDGFFPEIQEIEQFLPSKETRHNMLFSATVPREVLQLAREVLNDNSRFVQTIQKGETQTHEKIPQHLVTLNGLENQLPALSELVLQQKGSVSGGKPFKALVFLNANTEVILYSSIFKRMHQELARTLGRRIPVLEMHSKLTQRERTEAADYFRNAKEAIMFTSDVSARGMDYPNVSHVIQLGLPRNRDFYIHRLGRTGRGENSGEGWIMIPPFELSELQTMLRKLPLQQNHSLHSASADMHNRSQLSAEVKEIVDISRSASEAVHSSLKDDAFKGSMGYMTWVNDKKEMIKQLSNRCVLSWGMQEAPAITPRLAQILGLSNHVRNGGTSRSRSARDDGLVSFRPRNTTRRQFSEPSRGLPRTRAWA